MGKGASVSAPAADPNIGKAAMMQAQTGNDMLEFTRQSYADSLKRQDVTDALGNQVTQQQLDTMKQQAGWAAEDRARYTDKFQPMQDEYIEKANNWDSPERQKALAAEAKADVMSNAALAKQSGERNMAAMGINPNSGRFAGVERSADLTTGLAAAGAENNSRSIVRNQALALRESAINLGNGLPATASGSAALGLSAGSTALGSNMAVNGQAMGNNQIMMQGFGGAMQGYQGQASTLNQKYGNDISAYSAGQQASAAKSQAIGSAVGGIASAAVMM